MSEERLSDDLDVPVFPARSIEDIHARELSVLRHSIHRELCAAAALDYCVSRNLPVPDWAARSASDALCKLLRRGPAQKRGRSSHPVDRYQQDMIDYARWSEVDMVREKQKEMAENYEFFRNAGSSQRDQLKNYEKMHRWAGTTWDHAYECASMSLQGSVAHGGPDAVRASYLRVSGSWKKDPGTIRYNMLPLQFCRKLGIQVGPDMEQGRKSGYMYDLTL